MDIREVKTSFKIMEAKLLNNDEILFNYLEKIKDENNILLDKNILKSKFSRVYIITVNKEIYKIGSSEDKGGIKGTLSIYRDGGIKGRPSIRSYGIYRFILEELRKGNKVEFYMVYQNPIDLKVKGLFGFAATKKVNISAKYLEESCLSDYRLRNNNKFPKWNLQEQGLSWPKEIKLRHSKIINESTKRK